MILLFSNSERGPDGTLGLHFHVDAARSDSKRTVRLEEQIAHLAPAHPARVARAVMPVVPFCVSLARLLQSRFLRPSSNALHHDSIVIYRNSIISSCPVY